MGARRFTTAAELAEAGRFAPGSVLLYTAGAVHREYDGATLGWRSTQGVFFADDQVEAMLWRYGSMVEVRPETEVAAEALELLAAEVADGKVDPRLSTVAASIIAARARRYRQSPGIPVGVQAL